MRRTTSAAGAAIWAAAFGTLVLAASTPQVGSNTWAPAADMVEARAGAAAVLLYDGSILVSGGMNDAGVTASSERYVPPVHRFVRARSMDTPRANHTSTLLPDGRVLVAGGIGANGRALHDAEVYDPAADLWTPAASLHWARAGHTATALNDGRVVIVGGNDGRAPLKFIEIYDPDRGSFDPSNARMTDSRTGHAAALAADRTLLIAGGFDGVNLLSSVEIYDPSYDMVVPGPALAVPRIGHSATTLVDGKVLVAGGSSTTGELASAEVYDSATRAFRSTGNSMIVPRQRHQALLLPHNGQVLIVGGLAGGVATTAAEVYVEWQGPGGTFYPTQAPTVGRIWSAAAALSFAPGAKVRSGPEDGLLILSGGSRLADAAAPFKTSELYGFATVKTDKADYAPGTPVRISGGGWVPGERVTLTLQESPGLDAHPPLVAIADGSGNFVNTDFAPDEHDLNVLFYVTATGTASQAQTTFTDGLNSIAATLDGRTALTRGPSAAMLANVKVTAASTAWHSTGWRIAGSEGPLTCENTADRNSDGTFYDSFAIMAPARVGTYNAYFAAFSDDRCAGVPTATLVLANAVVIDAAIPLIDTTPPSIATIEPTTTSPTSLAQVGWNVTFTESVIGVGRSAFSLVSSGLAGAPAILDVSGSGSSYFVTASTGTKSGTIALNLVDDDSIVDAAGNALGGPGPGNGNAAGAVYTIDRTLTPQIVVASKSYDGTTAATIVARTLEGSVAAGDVVSLAGGLATFDSKDVGSAKTVTASGLRLGGPDAAKYVLSATTAATVAAITEGADGIESRRSPEGSGDPMSATAGPRVTRGAPSFVPAFVPTPIEGAASGVSGGSGSAGTASRVETESEESDVAAAATLPSIVFPVLGRLVETLSRLKLDFRSATTASVAANQASVRRSSTGPRLARSRTSAPRVRAAGAARAKRTITASKKPSIASRPAGRAGPQPSASPAKVVRGRRAAASAGGPQKRKRVSRRR